MIANFVIINQKDLEDLFVGLGSKYLTFDQTKARIVEYLKEANKQNVIVPHIMIEIQDNNPDATNVILKLEKVDYTTETCRLFYLYNGTIK